MTSAADDFIKRAVELREAGRLDEATLVARQAVKVDDENANSWWQLALTLIEKDDYSSALAALRKTIELAPGFAFGWFHLGMCYSKAAMVNEAVASWEKAVELDSIKRIDAMEALVEVYKQRQLASDEDKLFEIYKLLEAQGELTYGQLNDLGVDYHKRREYYKAMLCYRRYAEHVRAALGFTNLGLVYAVPEVGQKADAVDTWRRALAIDPDYQKASDRLDGILPKVIDLAKRVRSVKEPILGQDQWYANYLNPYELLNLTEVDDCDELDVKDLQRAKKRLLQEIDLEEGLVSWVPGLRIDRSRAISVAEEISDAGSRYWHLQIFNHRPLLDFMSRGSLEHFLVDPNESPLQLLETIIELGDDFSDNLGETFAAQFDLVFTKALERGSLDIIECLLDGRRWIKAEHDDKCFTGAHRQVERLLEPIRQLATQSEKVKLTASKVQTLLDQKNTGKIISMLPIAFQQYQVELGSLIRSISIDVNNSHDDADESRAILLIGKALAARSPSLLHKIAEDLETIEGNIAQRKKDEAFFNFKGSDYSVRREGIDFAGMTIAAQDVRTLRWGIRITRENGVISNAFNIDIGGIRSEVASLNWSSTNVEAQRLLFDKMVNACFSYLMPRVLEVLQQQIDNNLTFRIGPAVINRTGIQLSIPGWFGSKDEWVPWTHLRSKIDNGDLIITSSTNPKARISMALHSTHNAIPLHLLIKN